MAELMVRQLINIKLVIKRRRLQCKTARLDYEQRVGSTQRSQEQYVVLLVASQVIALQVPDMDLVICVVLLPVDLPVDIVVAQAVLAVGAHQVLRVLAAADRLVVDAANP